MPVGKKRAVSAKRSHGAVALKRVSVFQRDMVKHGYVTTQSPTSSKDVTDAGRKMILAALEQAIKKHKDA
jgi:hypothetical protein